MKNLPNFTILLGAAALMLAGIPFTAPAGVVAHYTFDNTVADATGNHNGVLTGAASYTSGVSGQALQFDGISNYVTLANPAGINLGDLLNDFSISTWIQTFGGGNGQQELIICKIPGYWAPPGKQFMVMNYDLYNDENGQGSFSADFLDDFGNQPNDGNWHHIAITYSARNNPPFTWYLDTTPIGQQNPYWQETPDATNEVVQVGAREEGSYKFTGAMDDLQIYDQALSQSQVQFLYNNPGQTVAADPAITTPPQSQNAPIGTNVTFTGTASGTDTLSYQWYFQGTNLIADATTSSLTLNDVTTNQSGAYTLAVSDGMGTVSRTASLVVYQPPVFSAAVYAGVEIWGSVNFGYQIQEADTLPGIFPWQTLTNLTLPSSPYIWFDLQSTNASSRFYQATADAP